MRLRFWVFMLACLALIASTPAGQTRALPNNVLVVNRSEEAEPPVDLLDEGERERVRRLQQDTAYTLAVSPVRPDDKVLLVTAGKEIGFLSLEDGSLRAIEPQSLEPFIPLPLLGLTSFAWSDATGLGALALNLRALTPEESFARLRIDSETLAISAEPLHLPPRTGLISASPDLRHLLLARSPPEPSGNAGSAAIPVRVPVITPPPGLDRMQRLALPPALRRQVDAARRLKPAALARVWRMLQDNPEGEVDAAPRQMDLVLWAGEGDELRYLTTIPEASVGLSNTWSRDSRRLAISFYGVADPNAARPPLDGALLSEALYRDATGNLPPALNPILQNNNTYVVDALSGAVQILRPAGGDAPPLLGAHAWAPDNSTLLVQAWHPAHLKGRAYPTYTPQFSERTSFRFYATEGGLREIGRLESDLFSAGLFAETRAEFITPDEIIFRAARGTDRHPYYYNRVSGELRNLADRAGAYYNVYSTNQSREIVFTFTSFTDPPDVYRMRWDGTGLARLTWSNEELRTFAGLRQDAVQVSLPGGQVRVGVLIQPADAPFPPRDIPIVVWQEGGPGVAMVNSWNVIVERPFALLPGMGLALLVTPLAGRPGYTPAVFNSLVDGANLGQLDIDEQAGVVRELIRRGWTSRGKVGMTGCSYGGYFTLQSLVRHPDLYAAANPQCALIDLISEWTRGYGTLAPYMLGLPPYNIPEEYRRDSPAYHAERIQAAVLSFHGNDDFLPVVQNQNLHLQLVNRGVDARMVIFLGEGHGLANEENQLYAAQEQIVWFRTHLQ